MKYFCKLIFVSILVFFFTIKSKAQNIAAVEQQLTLLSTVFLNKDTAQTTRDSASNLFYTELKKILQKPESYAYSFDKLNTISILQPDDKALKIFTWHTYSDSGTYHFWGLVQIPAARKRKHQLVELVDKGKNTISKKSMYTSLEEKNWYACQYYSIVAKKYKKQKYYVLLGINWATPTLNTKVIDALVIDEQGVYFGVPTFQEEGDNAKYRVVFQYAESAAMLLKYDKSADAIVFDRLQPIHPVYENNYNYYVPSFIYDGYFFQDGVWVMHSDIDIRNPK